MYFLFLSSQGSYTFQWAKKEVGVVRKYNGSNTLFSYFLECIQKKEEEEVGAVASVSL